MVGVTRPNSEQIIKNISNNLLYFKTNYPAHTFELAICSYKNNDYLPVVEYCNSNNILNYYIDPINNSDIPEKLYDSMYSNSPDLHTKNRYRMFYSMNYIMERLEKYDCVIRLRIDTHVEHFELFDTLRENTYYTVIDEQCKSCSDNIGYSSQDIMKNVWALKNCFIKSVNPEELVFNSIKKNKVFIKQFKFSYILFQSNDAYFNGIKQWSRRNRQWIYDGVEYIRGRDV